MASRKIFFIALLSIATSALNCRDSSTRKSSPADHPFIYGVDTITGSQRTVASNLARSKVFADFFQLISKAGYKGTLDKPGPFTVFAPTNEALSKLRDEKNDEKLLAMLTDHIIAGSIKLSELRTSRKIKTLSGNQIELATENDAVIINGKKIYTVAINCSNGIIYPVNELLILPQ